MRMEARGSSGMLFLLALTSLLTGPTQGQVPAPRRLRFKELGSGMLSVSWKEPKGEIDGYRLIYGSGGQEREVLVTKEEAKAVITNVDHSKEYAFKVITLSGGQQSKPLLGSYKASRSEVIDSSLKTHGERQNSEPEQDNEIREGKVKGQVGGDLSKVGSEPSPNGQ
ncbi:hypothetical protein NFI96_002790 [Prochilodus magdalenae]|nr:hypothetical protein NFI96_002790 [Prochilodus magdalenae]